MAGATGTGGYLSSRPDIVPAHSPVAVTSPVSAPTPPKPKPEPEPAELPIREPVQPAPSLTPGYFVPRYWVSYVYYGSSPSLACAMLRTSATLPPGLAALGAELRVYRDRDEELDRVHLRQVAEQHGLPCAIVQDAEGRILEVLRDPPEAALLAAIAKRPIAP